MTMDKKASMSVPAVAWHALSAEEVVRRVDVGPTGLKAAEVQQRLARNGQNELAMAETTGRWRILATQFASLIVWILIGAAIVSATFGEWVDAIAILVIVAMNALIGFYQEYNAERSIAALRRMTAPLAKVRRDGQIILVPAREVVVGDMVQLEAGDIVAADGRLLHAASLACGEAALTGESASVDKRADAIVAESAPLGDRTNVVFMGTSVTSGTAEAVVVATGMRTELGTIAELMRSQMDTQTPLQKRLQAFGRVLLWASLVIVVILFALGALRGEPLFRLFMTSVSLAVAAIPEGLPAVVTVALALGVQRMARRRTLVRKLAAVETLGSTSVICTDKTGTLTLNEMTVRTLVADGVEYAVVGEGYAPVGQLLVNGAPAAEATALRELLTIAVGCNGARLVHEGSVWTVIGDPTEGALLAVAGKGGIVHDDLAQREPVVSEHPFDSDRKLMTTVRRRADGTVAYTKGAPDLLLQRCTQVLTKDGVRALDDAGRAAITAANARLANQALRVLGAAMRTLQLDGERLSTADVERDLTFVGLYGMYDPPRAEAKAAVATCHQAGIRVVMITGDHPRTALAVAREIGIAGADDGVLSGVDLDALDDAGLKERILRIAVFARVTAAHKLRIVKAWKSRDAVVAMTGDGVNDAPAIKGADIGIAMGRTGTEVTKEAADMVVTDDNFASIVAAVEEGRGIYANIHKTIQYLLAGNAAEIMLMAACVIIGLPAPLAPIHLLWINLVTDGLPALCLAMDPVSPYLMRRPPRAAGAPLVDRSFLSSVLWSGLLIAAVVFAVFVVTLRTGSPELARTHAFAVLVFAELFRAFSARDAQRPLWRVGLRGNVSLLMVVAITFAIQISSHQFEWLARLFQTLPLTMTECLVLIGCGAVPLVVIEVIKAVRFRAVPLSPTAVVPV